MSRSKVERTLFSSFNLYKGGSLSIYSSLAKFLINDEVHELANMEFKILFGKNKSAFYITYPIKNVNFLYRLFVEQILVPIIGVMKSCDRLIMAGNYPALLWFGNQSIVFQNTLLLNSNFISIKFSFEKALFIILVHLKRPIFLVNTSLTGNQVLKKFGKKIKFKVIGAPYPFVDSEFNAINYNKLNIKKTNTTTYGFYPALYYPHKNHKLLFLIDGYLKFNNIKIILTINKSLLSSEGSDHSSFIFTDTLTRAEICEWYSKIDFLIFPSLTEALGVPLLEASQLSVPIISSNLEYVKYTISDYYEYESNSSDSLILTLDKYLKDLKINSTKKPSSKVSVSNINFFNNIFG
jgi:glycosyltransferase involved in cell wall biosynthesis